MSVLILDEEDVQRLLPMNECIDVMERAFVALARGEVEQPLRTIFRPPHVKGVMALMPTFRGGEAPLFGLKAICVFPGNAAIGKDAHQGSVILFDGVTGELRAIANASAITAIRTAAVSGLATKILAKPDASSLAIIGAGVQARVHLDAIACVRQLHRVRVAAGTKHSAARFAHSMKSHVECEIEPVDGPEDAVREADIIVTATTSREPVVRRDWIEPGAHINAIGTFSPKAREIDTATMTSSSIFVDRRESAFNEAGDYLIAAAEGAIGPENILAELGEVLIGKHPGRRSADEITIFKSLGLAMEDLAAADYCYRKATEQRRGTMVSI
ncbi:MAG TPA: ornithine cyclodeaminase family protein [Pyrinomonadaceae bacterium]|jgi:ornithine cyclodeaminase|nr:ornithine cyclodeaminase family protein [Pyrinomonadaceae bacterium]